MAGAARLQPLFFCILLAEEVRQGLALLAPLVIFRSGGKFHVTGGVQRSLNGVLNNANDEANADNLHGNIIGDSEKGTCYRD